MSAPIIALLTIAASFSFAHGEEIRTCAVAMGGAHAVSPTVEVLAALNEIESLESSEQNLRNFNGRYERTSLNQSRLRWRTFNEHLMYGETSAAVDVYRQVFRNVELGVRLVPALEKKIATLEGEARLADGLSSEQTLRLRDFKQQLTRSVVSFGEHYGEYVFVRSALEAKLKLATAANEHTLTIDTAEHALRNLGSRNLSELFPTLHLPSDRPTLDEVRDFYHRSPEAQIAKLKRDRKDEFWTSLRIFSLAGPVLTLVDNSISRLPTGAADSLKKLMGLARSTHLRDRYLPDVERIISLPNDPAMRVDLLRILNARSPADEFLVFFARVVDASGTWQAMKQAALAKGADDSSYLKLVERMKAAEMRADKLGDLSLLYPETPADRAALITAGGLGATAVIAANNWQPITASLHQLAAIVQAVIQSGVH